MPWHWCLLLLALSGVAFSKVQPPGRVQTAMPTTRSVSYTFTASPTPGATYKVTLTHQRAGILVPGAKTFNSPVFHTASNLIPDVTYTLSVFAVLNGKESTPVSAVFTTTPDVPSGPPQNLTVSDLTTTSVTLTWSDPAPDKINDRDGVTGFAVKKSGVQVAIVTDRNITFTGLTPASTYTIEVLAINEQGTAPANHAARLTVTTASEVPNPPTLRVVLPRFSSTFLVWSDPEPFAGPITGFQIHYLIDGVVHDMSELAGGVHAYSVSGIKSSVGKTHSVSLRAQTAAGYGDYSDPVVFIFRPIAEVDVTAVNCDTLQVDYIVNPLPGGDTNKASLQSFVVEYRPILGGRDSGTRSVPLNGNPAEGVLCLSGLRPDTPYRVTYNVEVNAGVQIVLPLDLSAPKQLFTLRGCVKAQCNETIIAPPHPPTLRVVLPRFCNIYLEWSDPEPFLGPITGFQIRYLIDGVVWNIPELAGGVHAYSVSGVKGSVGKTHSVSVRAKTAAGYGDYSDPVVFIFHPIVKVAVTVVDCTTLKITYAVNRLPGGDSNEASLLYLEVKYQPTSGNVSAVSLIVLLKGYSAEGMLCLTDLMPDTNYNITYSVKVKSSPPNMTLLDTSGSVVESTAEDCGQPGLCMETNSNVPDGPAQRVAVYQINSNTVEVRWMDPGPRHTKPGFEITRYLVIIGTRCGEGANVTVPDEQSQRHSVRFTDLEPGTTYCVRVVPGNVAGFALPQSVQSSDQMVHLPQIMSAPFIVGVTPHEHHAIVIWEKVESGDKDNPVTDYIIQIETCVDGEHMVYRRMFSSSEVLYFFNMTQLAAGRLYAVSVAAQNRLGMGRIGSTTFRTLVLTDDDKERNSSILPEGHDETAPDMGNLWDCPVPHNFTPRPITFPTPPPPSFTSSIGPLLKLYQDSKCNDVIRRPQYRVPVEIEENGLPNEMFLCYEVRGQANQAFNLVSDTCVSVNALYSPVASETRFISKIGVLAKDNDGQCLEIEVNLMKGCAVNVNGTVMRSYQQNGMEVQRYGKSRVHIAVPNCKSAPLVMWVHCQAKAGKSMMPFEITEGSSLGRTSHGLVGQFWNANVEAEGYNVTATDHIAPDPNHYAVTVTSRSGDTRRFFAAHIPHSWNKLSKKCLYAGDPQGGRICEVSSLPDSVIEGRYDEYAASGLFDPDYKYSQFTSQCP